jgi:hypothetical protein
VITPEKSSRLPRPPKINGPNISPSNSKLPLAKKVFKVIQANGRGRRVLISGMVQTFFPTSPAPTQGVANFKNLFSFTYILNSATNQI